MLDEIVAARTLAEWAERFDREGVWWAPAQGPAEVLEDPQLAATDGFLELREEPDGTVRRSINGPVSFSDVPVASRRAGTAASARTPQRWWPR